MTTYLGKSCSFVLPRVHFIKCRQFMYLVISLLVFLGSVRVAERLALPTSVHGVAGSNPSGGEIFPEPKRRFIAQSLSCSSFHRLEMSEKLLKGRKTLTHPSILRMWDLIVSVPDHCLSFYFSDSGQVFHVQRLVGKSDFRFWASGQLFHF